MTPRSGPASRPPKPGPAHGAHHIDLETVVPGLVVGTGGIPARLVRTQDAGIRDVDRNRTQLSFGLVEEGANFSLLGDIDLHADTTKGLGRLFRPVQVRKRDLGALRVESLRHGEADTPRAAGDRDHLALIIHEISSRAVCADQY
jgi:hypothetical protein